MKFGVGDIIGIPCEVSSGAFPDELFISIDTMSGPLSGFVNPELITNMDDGKGLIRAKVENVAEDVVTVRIRGSFFTTTGLAYFSPEWADQNAMPLQAA